MSVKQLGIAVLLLAAMASVARSQIAYPTIAPFVWRPTPMGPENLPRVCFYRTDRRNPRRDRPSRRLRTAPHRSTPTRFGQAYGLTSLAANGAGQTIAIIDAYDYPNALSALNSFSTTSGLPQFNQPGEPTFTQLNETGGTALPGTDPAGAGASSNWEYEEALDIESAHAPPMPTSFFTRLPVLPTRIFMQRSLPPRAMRPSRWSQ